MGTSAARRRAIQAGLTCAVLCLAGGLIQWRLTQAFRTELASTLAEERADVAAHRYPSLLRELDPVDGAPLLEAAFSTVAARGVPPDLAWGLNSAVDCPAARPAGPVAAFLEAQRAERDRVLEGLHRRHCAWSADSPDADTEASRSRRTDAPTALGLGLILDGHERLSRGDYEGALAGYVDALALSLRLGRGSFQMNLAGHTIATRSIQSLATLVGTPAAPRAVVARTRAALALARPDLPTYSGQLRHLRLSLVNDSLTKIGSLSWDWSGLLPWGEGRRRRQEIEGLGSILPEVEAVLALRSGPERRASIDALSRKLGLDPAQAHQPGGWASHLEASCTLLDRFDLLAAALALWRPADSDSGSAIGTPPRRGTLSGPIDGRLRIWSVGRNGLDDGGCGDDESLEVPLEAWGAAGSRSKRHAAGGSSGWSSFVVVARGREPKRSRRAASAARRLSSQPR